MPNVVIIGAGLAGLSAAAHLTASGLNNVLVLEASNRVGGRVHTVPFGAGHVELGAAYLHGPTLSHSVFTLINQAGIMKQPCIDEFGVKFCYLSNGRVVSPDMVDKLWSMFVSWRHENPMCRLEDRPSMDAYIRRRFSEEIHKFPEYAHSDLRCVLNFLIHLEWSICGADVKSAPFPQAIYEELPGGNPQVPEGLSKVCEYLKQQIPADAIKLNAEVVKISIKDNEDEVEIVTKQGERYTADHVIVTVPLGVLQGMHQTLFDPPLPAKHRAALKTMDFGHTAKIVLEWKNPFWRPGAGGVKLCWSDEELSNLDISKHWYRRMVGFDEVPNNRTVLLGWVSGEEATYMESLPEAEVKGTCTQLLRQFLRNPAIPEPDAILRSTFNSDQYFRGTYSVENFNVRHSTYDDLSSPILGTRGLPRIQFAGEATIAWAYSTMHGARTSGLREAQRIIDIYTPQLALKSKL